ncbi:hypothetical protein L596_001259 [Steinernema carpocapsae]|uniref:Uncharacterized protein n=1 Tax=Steinernema carpocapsae TaxID=34508 RepID=A0A4U8UPS0_STECR|nr:hypothetical protein L596_001259 [Steinernema carpocapsae]
MDVAAKMSTTKTMVELETQKEKAKVVVGAETELKGVNMHIYSTVNRGLIYETNVEGLTLLKWNPSTHDLHSIEISRYENEEGEFPSLKGKALVSLLKILKNQKRILDEVVFTGSYFGHLNTLKTMFDAMQPVDTVKMTAFYHQLDLLITKATRRLKLFYQIGLPDSLEKHVLQLAKKRKLKEAILHIPDTHKEYYKQLVRVVSNMKNLKYLCIDDRFWIEYRDQFEKKFKFPVNYRINYRSNKSVIAWSCLQKKPHLPVLYPPYI